MELLFLWCCWANAGKETTNNAVNAICAVRTLTLQNAIREALTIWLIPDKSSKYSK